MSKPKGNYFIIETYDEEKDMRVPLLDCWKALLLKHGVGRWNDSKKMQGK